MQRNDKRIVLAIIIAVGAILFALAFAVSRRDEEPKSWKPAVEGFLAVATPCCTAASLWDTLDTVTADGQRARPASVEEAAEWLNDWPYRSRDEQDGPDEEQPGLSAQSREVRCVGAPSGPDVPQDGDDEETLEAIRNRRECTYAKWKIWKPEAAHGHLNERHTIWVDENGFFHGRVDYWN